MNKKIISILTMVCFIMCFMQITCTAYADNHSVISFEEYSETLINEYAKYGMTVEMEPLPNVSYTKELLEKELNNVKKNIEAIHKRQFTTVEVNNELSDTGITPKAMYYDKTFTFNINKGTPPLLYTVKVTNKLQLDAQRDRIIKGYKPTIKMTAAVGYADYLVYKSHTITINNSSSNIKKRFASYAIKVEVKQEISVSGVTAWEKHTDTIHTTIFPFK